MKVGDKVKIISGNFSGEFGTITFIDDKCSPSTFIDVLINRSLFCFSQNDLLPLEENDPALIKNDSIPDNNQFSEEELNLLRNVIRSYQNMLEMFCVIPAIDNHKTMVNNLANRITNMLLKKAM